MKNLLTPFPTKQTEAVERSLYAQTTERYRQRTGDALILALQGAKPDYQASPHDAVLIDLDACVVTQDPRVLFEVCERTLAGMFVQFIDNAELNAAQQHFVLFSHTLTSALANKNHPDAQAWLKCRDRVQQLVHVIFQGNACLAPCPHLSVLNMASEDLSDFHDIVARVVAIFMHLPYSNSSTPKETSPMNYILTQAAADNLNQTPTEIKEIHFEFKDDSHVVGSFYENKEGGLKRKVDLWSMPVDEFFVAPAPTRAVLQLLNLYVLVRQGNVSLSDMFNGTFTSYVQHRRDEALPTVTKPKLAATWHNPNGVVGTSQMPTFGKSSGAFSVPGERMEPPAAFDNHRDLPRIDPAMLPESITVVRSKYLAILKHITNVKRWMALFMHLSKEEQAKKGELLARLAEHHQVDNITVVMPFAVSTLLSDEFLAAKQDGQYLGVRFSVEEQTKLGEVDVKCVFQLD